MELGDQIDRAKWFAVAMMVLAIIAGGWRVSSWVLDQVWRRGYDAGKSAVHKDIARHILRDGKLTLSAGDVSTGWIAHCSCERTE